MRKLTTTLLFCATASLGLLLGCATESPTNIPLSQTFEMAPETNQENTSNTNTTSTNTSNTNVSLTQGQPKSLVTLGADQDLAEIVRNAPGVVLIDFYATWCGPCVKQGKVLRDLENYASTKNASIIKIDVDQHKDLAEIFDISALPTLMLIKDGKIVDQQLGLANANRITELLGR